LNVKLKPDELGEIVVKVVLEKGQINGSIVAEKKDVVNILQNQVDNLKQELKNNNVNVNSISVNIGNEQGGSHQGYFNQNTKREKRNFENIFTNDLSEELDEGFDIIA
jgi:flagellar hook-length control protein FliK